MTLNRRTLIGSLAALPLPALAQDGPYPSRPIRMIVNFPPGGTTDIAARIYAERLQARPGQPVPVENRGGATGNIGAEAVARATPDGYTVLSTAVSPAAINYALFGARMPYKPEDLAAVGLYLRVPNVIMVHPSQPIRTIQDLVAAAKAQPGKLNFGSAGSGGSPHMAMEMFMLRTGTRMTHVPFRGAQEGVTALLGRQIDMVADAQAWRPQVEKGDFRLLSVWTRTRLPSFPETPTLNDLGYNMTVTSPYGFVGPKGLPPEIVDRLHTTFRKALNDEASQAIIRRWEMPEEYLGPREYLAFAAERVEYERAMVARLGLTID